MNRKTRKSPCVKALHIGRGDYAHLAYLAFENKRTVGAQFAIVFDEWRKFKNIPSLSSTAFQGSLL